MSTKETYYETLQNSSQLWHENKNDNLPFVKYCLGIIHRDIMKDGSIIKTGTGKNIVYIRNTEYTQ